MKKTLILLLLALSINYSFSQIFTKNITILPTQNGYIDLNSFWADFNQDGWDDLFVADGSASASVADALYINNQDGSFTKIEDQAPFVDLHTSHGASVADFDNNGYPDIYIATTTSSSKNHLYYNNGDLTFTEITNDASVNTTSRKSWGTSCADYNNDGFLDLFVATYEYSGNAPDYLFRNNGDGTFTSEVSTIIDDDINGTSNGQWVDYDNDCDMDLFVLKSNNDNRLYTNNGDGTFTENEGTSLTKDSVDIKSICWGDVDRDGDLDVYMATGFWFGGADFNHFFLNNGDGTFTESSNAPLLLEENCIESSNFIDLDNDGDLDLILGSYDPQFNKIFLNNGDGTFSDEVEDLDVGSVYANVFSDYDHDGDLDLFTSQNNYNGGNSCFFDNNGNSNNWLSINCVGTVSNADAIGAQIRIKANIDGSDVWQYHQILSFTNGHNNARNSKDAHFGLGDATVVDSIIVIWPSSGIINIITDVPANQFITITEEETTNINKINNNKITVYPNPAINYINITEAKNSNILIYNLTGKVVKSVKSSSQNCKIDVSELSTGTYFIKIIQEQNIYTEKIIIQ